MRTFIAIALLVALVAAQLPESYNVRDKYPQCTIPILNQGNCGSCWSHSVVEALSERFCIHSNGQLKPLLSQQYLANCDTGSSGCGGGDTLGAYNYIKNHGIDQSSCTAYTSGKTGKTGACPATCDGGEAILPQDLFKVTDAYSLSTGDIKKNVESMQQDILKNGPISASFLVRQDFLDFFRNNATKDGIYYSHGGRILGGHAIMIVGWGVGKVNDTVIPYWQAVNSWGPEWGDHGMFKIIRGSDDCNIESRKLSAGIPDVGKNSTLIFKRPPVFGKIKAELNNDDVCDGCWTTQTIDEEMHEKVQSMVGSYNYNIVNEVIEVKTRVANGVMYKIAVQASNDRNEVKKMYIVAHESATSDDINVLSVQH